MDEFRKGSKYRGDCRALVLSVCMYLCIYVYVCACGLITVNGLAGNSLGPAGAKDLSLALCKCQHLTTLDLAGRFMVFVCLCDGAREFRESEARRS